MLHIERAIQLNIAIMRAIVQLREMIGSNKGLARRPNELEKKYDSQFRVVFEAIRELMAEPEPKVKQWRGVARCPPCSQNAHDETVLVRCAQSRATLATPLNNMWGEKRKVA